MTFMDRRRVLQASALLPWISAGCASAPTRRGADRIFVGGTILTMSGVPAEAVAIAGGGILAAGPLAAVLRHAESSTVITDLGARVLMPGFIQAHAHFSAIAIKSALITLDPPPIGRITSIAALLDALRARSAPGPIVGMGYDDTALVEQRHPNRDDLDAVSTDVPVIALHISNHLAAVNSRGLALAGIGADTPDPPGGVIRRRPGSREPDGVLEESAMSAALALIGPVVRAALTSSRLSATALALAAAGFTTIVDHATDERTERVLADWADAGGSPVDLVTHRAAGRGLSGMDAVSGVYRNRYRLAGLKIVLDGSIQGWTAFLSQPYFRQRPGVYADYRGYPALSQQELDELTDLAHRMNWPLLAHANGDAAIDMFLRSLRAARQTHPSSSTRAVIIHAQTMREDQLDLCAALQAIPSFL